MIRLVTVALALAASLSFAGGEAIAAPSGFYTATPVTAPAPGKSIVRGLMWNCDGVSCAAPQARSRAAIICSAAARAPDGCPKSRYARGTAKSKGASVTVARAN